MEIINLDMTPSTVTPNAHAGQYDTARTVRFMLKNGGVPFTLAGTETITAEITRSDNTEATVNVANTSSNYVDVVFDDTVCTVKGLYACELRLKDSDGFDIGSKNFALLVQRDPYDGAGVHVETVGPADICTFETTLPEPLQSVIVDIVATGGNGTPDNPNPINGYSSANITRCGVNLLSGTLEDYQASTREYGLSTFIAYKLPNGTYTISTNAPTGYIWAGKSLDNGPIDTSTYLRVYDGNPMTITLSGTQDLIVGVLTTDMETACNYNTMVNIGSSPSPYTPYNGQTYAISFGQTVYGGVLDVTRGKLHVTWDGVDLGSLSWTYTTSAAGTKLFISDAISNIKKPISGSEIPNIAVESYPIKSWDTLNTGASASDGVTVFFVDGSLRFVSNAYTDAQVFANAMNGVILAYELATPFDIDLTPVQIRALVGENNVFADCGETEVEYLTEE